MRFEVEGFTGTSGETIKQEQLQKYDELFAFAKSCSKYAVQITQLLPAAKGKKGLMGGMFFARCTSQFQAAICLAEGGMTIEALVLCRSLLETFFVLNALAEGVVTPAELVSHDGYSRKTHANALLNNKKKYENVAPFEEKLKNYVAEQADSVEIPLWDFSRKANVSAVYDGLYRHLSHHAAHPSVSAVEPYLVDAPGIHIHAQYRPVLDYTPRAVLSACIGILMSCFACEKLKLCTPQTSAVGAQLWLDYLALDEAGNPWG